MTTTLILAAALIVSPQGHRLALEGRFPDDLRDRLTNAKSQAQGLWWVARTGGNWRKIALLSDTVTVWPAHQAVVAVLENGDTVPALELFASGPEPYQSMIRLGGDRAVRLDPSELMRWPYRGGVAMVLFAKFPISAVRMKGIGVVGPKAPEGR